MPHSQRRRQAQQDARWALAILQQTAEAVPPDRMQRAASPTAPFFDMDLVSMARRCAAAERMSGYLLHAMVVVVIMMVLGAKDAAAHLTLRAGAAAVGVASAADAADLQRLPRLSPRPQVVLSAFDASSPPDAPSFAQQLALFPHRHIVAPGETLGQIAQRYGLPPTTVFWANGFDSGDVLAIGRELRIPQIAGVVHRVQPGETIEAIGARYQVPIEALLYFGPNQLLPGTDVVPGAELYIPGATVSLSSELLAAFPDDAALARIAAVPAAVVRADETNVREGPGTRYSRVMQLGAGSFVHATARHEAWVRIQRTGQGGGWIHADLVDAAPDLLAQLPETNDFPPPPPVWMWPARGSVTSGFGSRWGGFHNGLDIANAAWTPITAARAGKVVEAGWCSGYGYCVKIAHDDDVLTEYGHLVDNPIVEAGDVVDAGDLIGYMGSTYDRAGGGYSTGIHLHFTVKVNGQAINPLTVLP